MLLDYEIDKGKNKTCNNRINPHLSFILVLSLDELPGTSPSKVTKTKQYN